MFGNKRTEIMFKKNLMSIKIPVKDKVLLVQSIIPVKKEIRKNKALAVMSRVALLGVLIILVFTSINLPLKDALTPITDTNSTDASNGSTDITEVKKIVISASNLDNYINFNDSSIPSSKEIYISDMLKSKMEEYKGQDVLFRVMISLPITQEEDSNFMDIILYESDEYAAEADTIIRLREELEKYKEYVELYEKYYKYLIAVKEGDIVISPEFEVAKKECENLKIYQEKAIEIYSEIYEIEENCIKNYHEILKIDKIEFAKNSGATKIEPVVETSEINLPSEYKYYMNLSEEMINKMAEHGGYMFKLALPERAPGYDRKISDSLVALLEQAQDNDEFHVAVVSAMDKSFSFAKYRSIICNSEYNSDLNTDWQGRGDLKNENVAEYIDNILVRNNISDKRVFNEKYPDFEIVNLGNENAFIDSAGFEAKLTKAQIIALIADQDVKVIYTMENSGNDNYYYGDE